MKEKTANFSMNPTEGSGVKASEEGTIGRAQVLVYRFGSHKSSLNQTDQAENRASPVNSEDYGTAVWPPTILAARRHKRASV